MSEQDFRAFLAQGNNLTNSVAVTTTSQTLQAGSTSYSGGLQQYRVYNSGSNITFIEIGAAGSSPTAGTTTSIPIGPNSAESFTDSAAAVFAVIGSAAGNTFYVTAGSGL